MLKRADDGTDTFAVTYVDVAQFFEEADECVHVVSPLSSLRFCVMFITVLIIIDKERYFNFFVMKVTLF